MTTTYDLQSVEFFSDPYPTFARMRQDDPVYADPGTGMWYVSRHPDVLALIRDRRASSDRVIQFFDGGSPEPGGQGKVVHRVFSGGMGVVRHPHHRRLRRPVDQGVPPPPIPATPGHTPQGGRAAP